MNTNNFGGFGRRNNISNDKSIITNIFEVVDKNENKLENDNNKRILLFHGTKTQNILGILSKGLLIAPIESQSQGNRFGTGIYLSDSFNKALGYTSTGKKKYILLVDTLLDKLYKFDSKNNKINFTKDVKMKGYNCLVNDAQRYASFEDRIFFNNGMTIPTKVVEKNKEKINNFGYFGGMDYDSEYVIYDSKLVNVKYIIEVEN